MKRVSFTLIACVAAFAALAAACGSDAATAPQAAASVEMKLAVPGKCIAGGCDPASPSATALGLLTVTNTGSTDAFLRACGDGPAISEQVFNGSTWVNVGPAVECAFPSTPIRIAAGQTLEFNWWFAAGTRRLVEAAGEKADLSDAAIAASNSVFVL